MCTGLPTNTTANPEANEGDETKERNRELGRNHCKNDLFAKLFRAIHVNLFVLPPDGIMWGGWV